MPGWARPGLHGLSNLAGAALQVSHAWMIGAIRFRLIFVLAKIFRGGPFKDFAGAQQLLNSSHVRERQKAVLRTNWVGAVWNGFLLGGVRGQPVPCRFCGKAVGDGPLFGECPDPPLVDTRENPECRDLMRMDKSQ